MSVVVEYLLIVPKADTFCDSEEAFNRLLRVDSAIDITGGRIRHREGLECDYGLTSGVIEGKEQRFFHLKFSNDKDDAESLSRFSELLKAIRSIMDRMGGQPETLWDDISFRYSREGYELIHRIENIMRKLIANFMLVKVGKEWVSEAFPGEVKEALSKSKRKEKDFINVLHTIDFIHLADFLLKPYSNRSTQDIFSDLKNATTPEQFAAIQDALPKSNWSRYFSHLVDCDDGYLRKRWDELYELRCKVAHNAIVTKGDLERISVLIGELQGKLEDAINKLPQVQVPVDEVQNIAESAASNRSTLVGEFIAAWQILESAVIARAAEFADGTRPPSSGLGAVRVLHEQGVISNIDYGRFLAIRRTRNQLVHIGAAELEDSTIRRTIEIMLLMTVLFRDAYKGLVTGGTLLNASCIPHG